MNVLVIGLGSMGKRRIRLIKDIDKTINIFGVDSNVERCELVKKEYGISTYENLEGALITEYDAAFVCTSPLSHSALISTMIDNGINVFTELNLVPNGYEENIAKAKEKNITLFLSSTFLYREEIQYITNKVKNCEDLLTYTYHVGQYLPDWHPWENYKDYFIGDERTNGCREIMAIEFPWICNAFGMIKSIRVVKNKKTKLATTYPDSYLIICEHENGIQGSLAIDVVSRKAVRNLEVFGENLYLAWDGSANGLKEYNIDAKQEVHVELYNDIQHVDGYANFVVENAYRNEIQAFFEAINGKEMIYGFEDDLNILKLIDEIEGK